MDEVCNLMEEHPFDCISYSMTGSWETIISYYSYTGGYSTTTYNGPVCEMKCDEQTESGITTIKKYATSMQCNNPNLYCKGFIINPEKPEEPSKDPEIDKNTYKQIENREEGVPWQLYRVFSLTWELTGDINKVAQTNKNIVQIIEQREKVQGLGLYLKENWVQYYKANP